MTAFDYHATDSEGTPTRGRLDADSISDVRRELSEQGFRDIEVLHPEGYLAASAAETLSASETEALINQLAQLSQGGVPLATGLRAAAEDSSSSPRLAAMLRFLASETEAGRDLEQILNEPRFRFPLHFRGLIASALRTGRLGEALTKLIDHQHRLRETWRSVVAAMAYPLIVSGIAFAVFILLQVFVVAQFFESYEEMGMELPFLTLVIGWWSREGAPLLIGAIPTAMVLLLLVRLLAGRTAWRRILSSLPLFGPVLHWSGVAEASRLLSILVEQNIPLPEALRLTSDGVRDANVGAVFGQLALGADKGALLSEMLDSTYRLPASLVPLIRWGEKSGELSAALRTASELFEGRVILRSYLLKAILPPLVFILIACAFLLVVIGLFLPMFSLIQSLAW